MLPAASVAAVELAAVVLPPVQFPAIVALSAICAVTEATKPAPAAMSPLPAKMPMIANIVIVFIPYIEGNVFYLRYH